MALLLFSTTVYAQIIPANRVTTWQPGVTYNGGIPSRTTIYKTLSPSGGDDTAAIQAALDGCPANQVVLLTAGVFKISGNGLSFKSPNCTLRGAGPGQGLNTGHNAVPTDATQGTFVPDPTATQIIKADRQTNTLYEIITVGNDPTVFSTSINLASNAVQGTNSLTLVSNPGIQVGEIVLVDMNTDNDPDVFWGLAHDQPGGGSRRWFMRQDRSLNQMMEVTAVNGNTITFATPFHITFQTANAAQLSRYAQAVTHGIGIEDIFFYGGMGGDWHGNVSMSLCAYCWIKHVEGTWSQGSDIGLYGTYRSELRDSYIHESSDPNPGGGGYLVSLNYGASDNLVENNIMWSGNKEIVMRATGGGNVIAYNYMDDSFGSGYPSLPEAGLNAGHYTTPHMELLEGNYSQNYTGDAFWGNSIYITVFRNQLSGIRAAHPPLNTYTLNGGGTIFPYMDLGGRTSAHVQAHSFYTNFVGNVLGFSGQTLLSYSSATYSSSQTSWQFEAISADVSDSIVSMWNIGEQQNPSGNVWVATTYQTQLRDGNWDWVTKSQSWLGLGGTQASPLGTPKTIPNSLYLASTPAFFGSNTWPWVDPATGTTFTLPAKARFVSGNPNQLANNNNLTVAVSASPSAGGTVAGGGTFAPGGSDTVTATPNGGSTFVNWTENGTVVSSAASYTFTLNGNRNLVANFTVNPVNYTIAVSASPSAGGTVSGSGTFTAGTPHTVTATANSGYTFTNWTENSTVVSSAASYTFTLNGNRNLVANFTVNPVNYTIAVSASPSAGNTASGSGTFTAGTPRTVTANSGSAVTASANSGSTFINWTENGTVVSTAASYTFTLNGNRNLVANFQSVAAQPPVLSTPTPSSALAGTSATFTWIAGTGISQYWLHVGTTKGGYDLSNQSPGTNLSATVSGLPANGQTLYVRLWWLQSGTWTFADYTYKAALTQNAVLLTPAPGSVLPATSSSVTFAWTSGFGVTQYWLHVGATPGGYEYYNATSGTALSAAALVPLNGQTIYVRLWSLIAGSWQFNDYTYTAGTGLIGVLTTPAPQSSLPGSSVTFSWTAGAGASQYWLHVGRTVGGFQYYNASAGTNLSAAVNGLPTDGRILYVRVWSLVLGVWSFNDYTYASGPGLTAPVPQSTLSGAAVTFNWNAATGATQYWLRVSGTSLGGTELYNQSTGTARSASVSGLPTDGRTIYVRFLYLVGGKWLSSDYLYTASGAAQRPHMTAPAPGLTLAGSSQTFGWSAGTGASQYWLHVGTTLGGYDLYNQSPGTNLSLAVSNLPTDGRILYVRLWYLSGSTWLYNDFEYFAAK